MVDSVLTRKNASLSVKVTVKMLVSLGIVALAVLLPQLVHLLAGAQSGMRFLPMYLPVLLGGCLLGARFGVCIGVLSPLVSFFLTSATGNAMPAAARLPFMMAELAVFALVSGLFSRAIVKNAWMAFPAVLLGSVAGRCFFLLCVAAFQWASPLTLATVWAQVQTGFTGLLLQAVLVPVLVMGLHKLLVKDANRQ